MNATDLPAGTISRLVEHYGDAVGPWLGRVAAVVGAAAKGWGVDVTGYHDAGWTSVVAVGASKQGRRVVIKASPDTERYQRERAALLHWAAAPATRLVAFDDMAQLLLLDAVAGLPGGAQRPVDHQPRVAAALSRLHRATAPTDCPVPLLADHYRWSVIPRVERRAGRFDAVVGPDDVARCLRLSHVLCDLAPRNRMLHADLYAENVLFDEGGSPVFIDPHAKIGSPAFDWAFWCVYYLPTAGFADRLALCREYAPDEYDEAVAWSMTLAVDGALYYLDVGDGRASAMLAVLASEPLARVSRLNHRGSS